MADRRSGFIVPLIILAFIFLTPEPRPNRLQLGVGIEDYVLDEQRALEELLNSTYSQQGFNSKYASPPNVTGLEAWRNYAWDALPLARDRMREQMRYALGDGSDALLELDDKNEDAVPLYQNISSVVQGKWTRSKLEGTFAPPRVNLTDYTPINPFGPVPTRNFGRNITGNAGDISVKFNQRPPIPTSTLGDDVIHNITRLDVDVTLYDDDGSGDHELRLYGVYFPTAGQAVLSTTSDKFAGIFLLPHFALSQQMFDTSRALLNESISNVMQRQLDYEIDRFNPWSSTPGRPAGTPFVQADCELVLYLQQIPPIETRDKTSSSLLSFVEHELDYPTGALLPSAPDIRFSMVAFSPDCGYVLESKGPPDYVPQDGTHLHGGKEEVLFNVSRHHLLVFATVIALQLALLIRQMREACTPSTRSRISLYTIATLAFGDSFTFSAFIGLGVIYEQVSTALVGVAFLAFLTGILFGMRFCLDVWTVQAPERAEAEREEFEEWQRREAHYNQVLQRLREERAAELAATAPAALADGEETAPPTTDRPAADSDTTAQTVNAPPTTEAPPPADQTPPGSLPLPVTAQRPTDTGAAPVFFMPSDQEGLEPVNPPATGPQTLPHYIPTATFGSFYTRFSLLLFAANFIAFNAIAWPPVAQRFIFTALGLLYLSFWYPQIIRNAKRNCRHALNWEYVLGQSALRLFPFAYFYGYERNIVHAQIDYINLSILAIWLWIQVLLLGSQELIGPRWFVRKSWVPPAYDYHPVLREDEEGATMPIGFSQAAATSTPGSPILERDRSLSFSAPPARRGSTATKEVKDKVPKGKRIFDCAICMQDLEVSVIEPGAASENAGLQGPAGLLARRAYMVTPCRHIFHSACLEGWMKYRLQCPICRETLPAL